MNTIRDIIREHHDGDNQSTADKVFAAVNCPAKWRELFYPLVFDECRRLGRAATVAAITEAAGGHQHRETHSDLAPGRSARPAWLAQHICCGPDLGYVTLGAATVEHHRGRIAMQLRLRGGIDADIARHQAWVDEIEAAGVSCLDDLYAKAAA